MSLTDFNNSRLPNFFIIGAAKSGTTSLYRHLGKHPDVFLPSVKEPRYYAYEGEQEGDFGGPDTCGLVDSIVKTKTEYLRLFQETDGETAVGDASPAYLYSSTAASNIYADNPEAKIITVLRNPVDRAYSHFMDNLGSGWEPRSDFNRVIDDQLSGGRDGWWRKWDYVGHGFYHEQLKRYYQMFDPAQIRVYLFGELKNDSLVLLEDLLRFLNVETDVRLDPVERHNTSGIPRNATLHRLMATSNPARSMLKHVLPARIRRGIRDMLTQKNRYKPPMPDAASERLYRVYLEDVCRLEELINRDLTHWKYQ